MSDVGRPHFRSEIEIAPLPDDFIDFLALDLAVSRERAQSTLVRLLEAYRPSESPPQGAWRERKPEPLS